jgi:hypothetical protein
MFTAGGAGGAGAAGGIFGAIAGGIFGGIAGGMAGRIFGAIAGAIVGGIIGGIIAGAIEGDSASAGGGLGAIAGAIACAIGMSAALARTIPGVIGFGILGAIAGAIIGAIAGAIGTVALNKRGTIGGGIAGAISGAIVQETAVLVIGFIAIGAMKNDEEGQMTLVFRAGAVALLAWCAVVWFLTRPTEPVPLKTKAILIGIIGSIAAIFIIWKYSTVYSTPDGTWEFGRMIRITISGNDFTFSTKETGAFVDTNKGTLQIENVENGKEITFTVTGGMSGNGEWATSSGEPQTLTGSLSDDGKSLTLDELSYTKKWNVWDGIFAFFDSKENTGSENAEPAAARVVVSANSANFREGPSAGTTVLKTLTKGDTLTVTGGADNGWLPVEHDGVQGYVSEDLLSAAPAPVPALFGGRPFPGLYVGSAYRGYMDLSETMNWIAENAEDGGVYSIVLGKNPTASDIRLDYGGKQVTVSLKTAGEERIIDYPKKDSDSALFTVAAGATLTVEDGAALSGLQNKKNKALVVVDGGTFIMNGGGIRNNTRPPDIDDYTVSAGGGVQVIAGTFTMNGGTIGGNAAKWGGGVYIGETGTFTMNGGTIGGNAASGSDSYGGGVYVDGGTFAMHGGSIGGNTADHGAGVHGNLSTGGTFTKTGGIIYGSNAPDEQKNQAGQSGQAVFIYISDNDQKTRDTTAGENTVLDSGKNGAAGGWGR